MTARIARPGTLYHRLWSYWQAWKRTRAIARFKAWSRKIGRPLYWKEDDIA